LIIASSGSGVSPWLTMPSSGQFAIYQPSSPGSITAMSLGSFTPKKVHYPALCANSAKGGWQQRQVVGDSEIKCGNWQTCQTCTCRDVSSHDCLGRVRTCAGKSA